MECHEDLPNISTIVIDTVLKPSESERRKFQRLHKQLLYFEEPASFSELFKIYQEYCKSSFSAFSPCLFLEAHVLTFMTTLLITYFYPPSPPLSGRRFWRQFWWYPRPRRRCPQSSWPIMRWRIRDSLTQLVQPAPPPILSCEGNGSSVHELWALQRINHTSRSSNFRIASLVSWRSRNPLYLTLTLYKHGCYQYRKRPCHRCIYKLSGRIVNSSVSTRAKALASPTSPTGSRYEQLTVGISIFVRIWRLTVRLPSIGANIQCCGWRRFSIRSMTPSFSRALSSRRLQRIDLDQLMWNDFMHQTIWSVV